MGAGERMFYAFALCAILLVCFGMVSKDIEHLTSAVDRLTTQIQHEQTMRECK